MLRFLIAAIFSMGCSAALAQETTDETTPLCDGSLTGNPYNLAAIDELIGGQWSQLGRAQRLTFGSPVSPFEVVYDDVRNYLIIQSTDGPRTRLRPFSQAKLAEVPITVNNLREDQISYISEDGSQTLRFTGNDFETLTGCPLDVAPSFYWTMSRGSQQYFGVLVFLSEKRGMGVIGNSTGARRTTFLYR
jgi:hypothetical protein